MTPDDDTVTRTTMPSRPIDDTVDDTVTPASILEPVEVDTPAVRTLDPVEIDTPTPAVQTLEPAAPAASPGSAAIFALAGPAGSAGTVDHVISKAVSTGAMFPSPHAPSATPDPLPVRSTGLPGAPSLVPGSLSGASSFSPDPNGSSTLLAVLTATVATMIRDVAACHGRSVVALRARVLLDRTSWVVTPSTRDRARRLAGVPPS